MGYWTGAVVLKDRPEVVKLLERGKEIYGIAIGRVDDFDCYGATIYCTEDGRCHYASEEFSLERIIDGWTIVEVIGEFDLRQLHSDQILHPC